MNFFLAFVVFTGLFLYGTNPMTIIPMDGNQSQLLPSTSEALKSGFLTHSGIQISPLSGSIASRAGAFSWDIIVSIAGTTPRSSQDVIDIIRKNEPFDIVLESSGWEKKIRMTPESGKVGMVVGYKNLNINKSIELKYNFPEAIVMGWKETIATTRITFDFLGRMLVGLISPKTDTERQEAKDMLSWPIGLGSTFVSIVENNVPISIILVMIALLSINLWVVNILPFPALDGGRIVTTILYSIAWYIPGGKKYFPTLEWALHTIWFLLLIGFMLYVSGLDISRFF
jgi:regulator of sigma E protease